MHKIAFRALYDIAVQTSRPMSAWVDMRKKVNTGLAGRDGHDANAHNIPQNGSGHWPQRAKVMRILMRIRDACVLSTVLFDA